MEVGIFIFIILFIALVPPFVIYFFWCKLAINFLEYKTNKTALCIGLGLLRFFLGLTLGLFAFGLMLKMMPSEWGKPTWINILWISILLSPIGAFEWGIISFLIGRKIKKNNFRTDKYNIKNISLWIIGGTVLSIFISTSYLLLLSNLPPA